MAKGNPNPRTDHLRPPWPKGVSGNPGGRPKKLFTAAMEKTLTPERAENILAVLLAQAEQGNLEAAKLLWGRLEGSEVKRQEEGQPGAFDAVGEVPDDALRTLLDLASKRKAS